MKNSLKRLNRLALASAAGLTGTAAALSFPIVYQISTGHGQAFAEKLPNWMIAATLAATAPETIDEMTTAVTGFATGLVPGWLMYGVFALIAALGIWVIVRLIRGMKSA